MGHFWELSPGRSPSDRKRAFYSSILFTIFIYGIEEYFLGPSQGWFLNFTINTSQTTRLVGYLTSLTTFTILVCLIWISFSAPRAVRITLGLLLTVAIIIQFGYWKALSRFISPVDLAAAAGSSFELWNIVMRLFFNPTALIPVGMYWLLTAFNWQNSDHRLSIWLLVPILVCVGLNSLLDRASYAVNPGTSVQRIVPAMAGWMMGNVRLIPREIIAPITQQKPANNIVLIIDESIRADHLSINGYSRPTTPFLETLATHNDLFYNWGTAVSGATCSSVSNSLLISGVTVTPQNNRQIPLMEQQYPTLFNYAKAMGYQTYYFQAQGASLYNGLGVADLKVVDHWIGINELGEDNESDFRAADQIYGLVKNSTGNFIILNKRGVHFGYEGSYPPGEAVWLPTPTDYLKQPDLVKNAYDNGVLYNVNTFFKRLLPAVTDDTRNTVYLYTSDHGQTLFEHGETWLHCNYTPNEASVPLVIIGHLNHPPDVNYPASHRNIFTTILDFMSVPETARLHEYPPSLLRANLSDRAERYYLDGNANPVRYPP